MREEFEKLSSRGVPRYTELAFTQSQLVKVGY